MLIVTYANRIFTASYQNITIWPNLQRYFGAIIDFLNQNYTKSKPSFNHLAPGLYYRVAV